MKILYWIVAVFNIIIGLSLAIFSITGIISYKTFEGVALLPLFLIF